ncbi:MAG: hypothetical protein SFV15_11600 [Polyangiaceae bacterium]|nr:hypothetical protein [Polyangiaceae bacterium]
MIFFLFLTSYRSVNAVADGTEGVQVARHRHFLGGSCILLPEGRRCSGLREVFDEHEEHAVAFCPVRNGARRDAQLALIQR